TGSAAGGIGRNEHIGVAYFQHGRVWAAVEHGRVHQVIVVVEQVRVCLGGAGLSTERGGPVKTFGLLNLDLVRLLGAVGEIPEEAVRVDEVRFAFLNVGGGGLKHNVFFL